MFFTSKEIASCYLFAQKMKGNHHPSLIMDREEWEIFRDDFRGKLGEIALMKYVKKNMPFANIQSEIDFEVTPRGQWDITDLIINNKYINVKSIKQKSNFLMIEKKRYNSRGEYVYDNNNGESVRIDAYVLVRVNVEPDIKSKADMSFTDVDSLMKNRVISAEILGAINHKDFWNRKHLAEQGIKCTYPNLCAVCRGVSKDELPEKIKGGEKKTEILQQDNYILNGSIELESVQKIV